MKKNIQILAAGILALPLISGTASAATTFIENFDSNTSGPNLSVGTTVGTGSNSFATGDWVLGTEVGNIRTEIRTNDTDYALFDFTFTATVTVANATGSGSVMIGMGTGINGNQLPPAGNIAAFARADDVPNSPPGNPNFGNNRFQSIDNGVFDTRNTTDLGDLVGGTHLFKMDWIASTKIATFSFDTGNNGSFENAATFTLNYTSFDATNSRLFLAGGDGLTVSNVSVSVVPEPGIASLSGAAGMLLLLRRRRHA